MTVIRNGFQNADLDIPVVLPTLNLDFANSQSLDERITFTRGSIGTFVNKNGLIETAAANIPRFDYDPITGECKGLLIEEQRTNLVVNSTSPTFTSLTGISTTTDGSLAPDGSNAIVYIPTTTATYHASNSQFCIINLDTVGIATGSTYDVTFSIWVKDYNNSDLGVYFVTQADISGSSPTYALRIAKPKSASWIGGGLGTGWTRNYEKVIPYQNGWYRFIQSYRYTRQTSYNRLSFYIQIFNNRNAQFYNGDGTSGIYIWGPQVETAVAPSQGAFETSYIPTSGSTVTRSADLANMTGTNFSSWYNQSEGTIFADLRNYSSSVVGNFGISIGSTSNNYFAFPYISASGTLSNAVYWREPSVTKTIDFPNGGAGGKYGISYKNSQSFSGFLNGSSGTVDAPPYPNPTGYNELYIGRSHFQPTRHQNFYIRRFTYYPKALPPAQLQYLTQ